MKRLHQPSIKARAYLGVAIAAVRGSGAEIPARLLAATSGLAQIGSAMECGQRWPGRISSSDVTEEAAAPAKPPDHEHRAEISLPSPR